MRGEIRDTRNESRETRDTRVESRETRGEKRETRNERRETRDERRKNSDERRETIDERREARKEERETRGERRETRDERQETGSWIYLSPCDISAHFLLTESAANVLRGISLHSGSMPDRNAVSAVIQQGQMIIVTTRFHFRHRPFFRVRSIYQIFCCTCCHCRKYLRQCVTVDFVPHVSFR